MPEQPHRADVAPARIRDRPTWLISRAYTRSAGLLNDGFASQGAGLRSYHYRLLAALDEWGPASQADLGRSTGIDRSDVAAALQELADRGLIGRAVDPDDRRRNIVSITRSGTRQLGVLDQVISDVQERLLAAFVTDRAASVHQAACIASSTRTNPPRQGILGSGALTEGLRDTSSRSVPARTLILWRNGLSRES